MPMHDRRVTAVIVTFGVIGCALYPISPGVALILGFVLAALQLKGLSDGLTVRLSKRLLAWAIVGFGATVTLHSIMTLTTQYLWPTLSGIGLTVGLGWFVGKLLGIDPMLSALIGSGTAICGASAIASVGSAVKASSEKLSMALGVVLILNAIALILFPYLGHILHLSSHEFAAWAGLAIHDTSSVLGAALSFDPTVVDEATTVKLARALWIAPVTALFAKIFIKDGSHSALKLPWFIWGYLLAATAASYIGLSHDVTTIIGDGARRAFRVGLFLTGCTININLLRALGIKPLLLGVFLWIVSASWSLFLIAG